MKRFLLGWAAAALCAAPAFAQLSITTPGVAAVETFDAFAGAGFSSTPGAGQLDSDAWSVAGFSDGSVSFGGASASGDFARGASAGGVSTGGVYAFDVGGGNIALGVQPGGPDFTPGSFTLRAQNLTGVDLQQLELAFTLYTFNNEGRSSSWNFEYSFDSVAFVSTPGSSFLSDTTADASPSWVAQNHAQSVSANWGSGDYLYLRWTSDDVAGSGSRDEFAIDDISILASLDTSSPLVPVPEPATYGLLAALALAIAVARRRFSR